MVEEMPMGCPELHPSSCRTRLHKVASTPVRPPVFPHVSLVLPRILGKGREMLVSV